MVTISGPGPTCAPTPRCPPSGMDSSPDSPESSDRLAGFPVLPEFERFHQKNDVFSRSFWDDEVRSGRSELFYETYRTPLKKWKKVEGFTQRDYAIRNASWHLPDIFAELKEDEDRREGFLDEFTVLRPGPDDRVEVPDPAAQAREIKHVAATFGADLVGITDYDERLTYASKYSRLKDGMKPPEIPEGTTSVIVIAQAMDRELIRTVPSALSGTATGIGYSQDTVVLLALAQYIVNLGYTAVPSMNDSALAIPYGLKAGLGEYGRHGLLITEEFGPRIRLGKIFTDLPLTHDRPKTFGVREFCETCRACTNACPAKAIPGGAPTAERHNQSNLAGVVKWSVDGVRCFKFWANQNSDCSICVRVCPYNRDYTKARNRWWRRLAGTPLRGLMRRIDGWAKRGQRVAPKDWWRRGTATR